MSKFQALRNFIEENPDEIFTQKDMVQKFNLSQGDVSQVLRELQQEGKLMSTTLTKPHERGLGTTFYQSSRWIK